MKNATMNDDRKRQLLSSALHWIAEVEHVNSRVAFQFKEVQESFARGPGPRETSGLEVILIYALRERFGALLGNSLFTRLIYVTPIDLHVLVLALEHISTSAPRLRRAIDGDAAKNVLGEYARLWRGVQGVRNALEHEEEYLAGVGSNPHLEDPSWRPPWVGTTRHNETCADGLVTIEALGKSYRLREVIDCCVTKLRPRLAEVLAVLSRHDST